jgi:hypothetical protein
VAYPLDLLNVAAIATETTMTSAGNVDLTCGGREDAQ